MNIYDTNVLVKVVRNLKLPQSWFFDRYFRNVVMSDTQYIAVDIEIGGRRVAPFVSPLVEGKVVRSEGLRTEIFEPAYVKDKRVFDPKKALRRSIGETIGGNMAAVDRVKANLNVEMQDQLNMLHRRLELMAIDSMLDGKTIVEGEGFATVEVDFGRDAALSVALAGVARWGEAGVSPADDIEAWALLVLQKSGASPRDVIFTKEAWDLFKVDPRVVDSIETRRGGGSTLELGGEVELGATFKGVWGNFNIFVYNDWYVDDAGVEQPMIPPNTVMLSGEALEGDRHFGAILDEDAGYRPMEFFAKSWTEQDPAVRYLLMQSAPLPSPRRVNHSFTATVR